MIKGELEGKRFGRLIAVREAGRRSGSVMWECICDCGKTKIIKSYSIRSGVTQSCGCLQAERVAAVSKANAKYLWKRPEYKNWSKMKERCLSPKDPCYYRYGGRGITICPEWIESFEQFLKDMGPRTETAFTIERIDVNGNYEPSNCRWATPREQVLNMRSNRFIEFNGLRLTLSQWSKRLGLNHSSLHRRIKEGWSLDRALTAPPDQTVTQFKMGHSRIQSPSVAVAQPPEF